MLLAGYLALLVYFLFFSEGFGRTASCREYRYNLRPFQEILRFVRYRHIVGFRAFFINIFGNILAFVPLGCFLPLLAKRKSAFCTVLGCFTFSLAVELTQLVTKLGCCDVDDLLLNTCGGGLGYLLYVLFRTIRKRKGAGV